MKEKTEEEMVDRVVTGCNFIVAVFIIGVVVGVLVTTLVK